MVPIPMMSAMAPRVMTPDASAFNHRDRIVERRKLNIAATLNWVARGHLCPARTAQNLVRIEGMDTVGTRPELAGRHDLKV